jgi:hypothetical protein
MNSKPFATNISSVERNTANKTHLPWRTRPRWVVKRAVLSSAMRIISALFRLVLWLLQLLRLLLLTETAHQLIASKQLRLLLIGAAKESTTGGLHE